MELSPLNKVIPSWGAPTLEGFQDVNTIKDGQRLKGSNRQYVRFYKKKEMQVYTTKAKINEITGSATILEQGTRENEREYVEIITPGDKNTVDDFAEDFHKREHWQAYRAFRDGRSAPIGTDVDEVSFIPPNIATELKYLGCHTLEQLADAADILCDRIPNGHEIREFARATCRANLDNKSLTQVNLLKGELEKSQALIASMQEQMNQMQGMILNQHGKPMDLEVAKAKKAPGKPKKTELTTVE